LRWLLALRVLARRVLRRQGLAQQQALVLAQRQALLARRLAWLAGSHRPGR
jgi:hypothetical protein